MSSSTSNSPPPPPDPPSNPQRLFGHTLPNIGVKLDNSNFLIWKSRFTPFLRAYHLLDIVEGTSTCPAPPTPASEIQTWKDYDQLALGWILSTVDDFTATQLLGCTSSHAAWSVLATNFSQQTQARSMQLRAEFDALTKGSSTMTVYLNRAKLLANQLAAIDRPLSPDELLSRVLHGLGSEYAGFRALLNLTERTHTLDSLHGPLLNHEASLLLDATAPTDLSSPSNISSFSDGAPPAALTVMTGRTHATTARPPTRGLLPTPGRSRPPAAAAPHQVHRPPSPPFGLVTNLAGSGHHSAARCATARATPPLVATVGLTRVFNPRRLLGLTMLPLTHKPTPSMARLLFQIAALTTGTSILERPIMSPPISGSFPSRTSMQDRTKFS